MEYLDAIKCLGKKKPNNNNLALSLHWQEFHLILATNWNIVLKVSFYSTELNKRIHRSYFKLSKIKQKATFTIITRLL